MSNIVISVEHLSKAYRLGQIGTGSLTNDLKVWWAKVRGKPNPFLKIGETDHGNRDGETIWALKDISFTVEQGEALGIIGRNGAGKSTLLKILSQVTSPTSGVLKVKGRIASLLEVGTGFHPDLTGRENIYLNGAILGMTKAEINQRFDEIVDFSGVEKFIDTPVKRYSSGMYVRLAFAVAAHLEPEILIVDEVLAVGDAEFQKKCLGKLGDVASKGRTVLFVSHNLDAVKKLCKRAFVLNHGMILNQGQPEDVILDYISQMKSLNIATPVIELPDKRIDHMTFAKATTLSFFSENRIPSTQFFLKQKWIARLEMEISEPIDDFIASVGLINWGQLSIASFWSKPQNLQPGKYAVEFKIDFPLTSGELHFNIGLSSHGITFYYCSDIGCVNILELANDGIQPYNSKIGVILTEQKETCFPIQNQPA